MPELQKDRTWEPKMLPAYEEAVIAGQDLVVRLSLQVIGRAYHSARGSGADRTRLQGKAAWMVALHSRH